MYFIYSNKRKRIILNISFDKLFNEVLFSAFQLLKHDIYLKREIYIL